MDGNMSAVTATRTGIQEMGRTLSSSPCRAAPPRFLCPLRMPWLSAHSQADLLDPGEHFLLVLSGMAYI